MKKFIESSSNIVKYYEVDFNNGYGMVIKSKIEPTREQIEEFVKVDADKNGGVADIYGPSTREEVSPFYDMENESNWPILESTSIKCSARDPYKVDWLKKALQYMQEDEYFIPRLNVNDNGRHIDLDEGAIQVLIDYYS